MEYDVALSFAGEDRDYVEAVAGYLRRSGVAVFYDKYEQVDLWGKDLYEHLSDVYQNKARYTVMFVSAYYAEKLWPRHERRSAQARAFREMREYILPALFDDTEVPGLPDTVGYLDLKRYSPKELAEAICEKLVHAGVSLEAAPMRSFATEDAARSPGHLTVTVRGEDGAPISGADVLLLASNGTHLRERTNNEGHVQFDVPKRRELTVFCAHPQTAAYVSAAFDPIRDLSVTLATVAGTGSLVALRGWTSIPGIQGPISPIHDSANRLYMYTRNVAVDGGKQQPVSFEIGKALHIEDAAGHERFITFIAVVGDCFLIEYRVPQARI